MIRNDGAAGIDHRSCEQLEKELGSEEALLWGGAMGRSVHLITLRPAQ